MLEHFVLFFELVIFGFVKFEHHHHERAYLINLLLILGKFHIHKCKFSNRKPAFTVFHKEFELYLKSIVSSENEKAVKTIEIYSSL